MTEKVVKKNVVKKKAVNSDKVACITLRKIGLSDEETSGINEEVMLDREVAIKLQDAGAIKVKL